MKETRRADQMLPGFRVRFPAGATTYIGVIAWTTPVLSDRVEFTFEDRFRWTFLNSDLFHRDWPDAEADSGGETVEDKAIEFVWDELAPVPA